MRYLSGVQPTGRPHLGNYFGAIKQHVELQDEAGGDAFYFIADYHSLTSITDAAERAELVREVALAYLAFGLDPARCVFYRQSDVPEVCELTWFLSCVTGMGLLERAHSYKDKTARGIKPNVGLFTYPILMAADILIVQADCVPVGQDQVQHVEMAQDMAGYLNNASGRPLLKRPEWKLSKAAKVPGTDGQKMSKSYGNVIDPFAAGKALKKSVMGIVTKPVSLGDPLPVEGDTVLDLLRLVADGETVAQTEHDYRSGAVGYGEAKKRLLAAVEAHFSEARERRADWEARPDTVEDVLRAGAARAREVAAATVASCRDALGFSPPV